MSFQAKTKKILHNFLPAKKLALFALLAVLVLGFSFALSNVSHAAFTFTNDAQKNSFIDAMYKDPAISTMYSSNATGRALVASEKLPDYLAKYNSYDDAMKGLQSQPGYGQGTDYQSSVDVLTGNQQLDNQVGLTAAARGLLYAVGKSLLAVIIGVLAIIVYFCKDFVSLGAQVLDLTLSPNLYNFANSQMVVQGWTVVRDVCNLFFLLLLLFIAMCTILQIEKYHAKKTLLMLIIMALLINFSKPIAVFIFDGSQLLMNFFLSQMGPTGTEKKLRRLYPIRPK